MDIDKMQKDIDDEFKSEEVNMLQELACMLFCFGCAVLIGILLVI